MEIKHPQNLFNKEDLQKSSLLTSCLKCGHVSVCAVFKAIKPLMGNWEAGQQPFKPEDISKVCLMYAENFIILPNEKKEAV